LHPTRPRPLALLLLTTALAAPSARAEEGMWLPRQLPALAGPLAALGFKGDAGAFADVTGFPLGAVVSLGGCSASFVSPEGLIVTNHHCIQGPLQFNSRPDRNLMVDGFLARERAAELPGGPGSRVFVTVAVEDVTAAVKGNIPPEVTGRAYFDLLERRQKELTAAREREPGYRCTVTSFFEGLQYLAITQLEIRDVRLVYAPAAGIGNFGGETDNWQWPRHTGDFGFLRAYVGPDGRPAAPAPENVPYRPPHWLKVSTAGASPGDLVFVAGYPGRTARFPSFDTIRETVEYSLPRLLRRYPEQIALLERTGAEDPETALRVSTRIRGLHNALTKTRGVQEAMVRGGVLAQKEAAERELLAWIEADAARRAEFGAAIPGIRALQAERARLRERNLLLGEFTGAGTALGAAETLHRLAAEAAKPDAERDPQFQERNWPRLRESLERLQRSLDRRADRALLAYHLESIAKLPADARLTVLDRLVGLAPGQAPAAATAAITAWVDRQVSASRLYDRDFRLGLFAQDPAALTAAADPLLQLAAELFPVQEQVRTEAKDFSGRLARLSPVHAAAVLAHAGGRSAPDANGTLRVTFGTVKGVESRDGLFYLPQTTLRGVAAKATGNGDFHAPAAQLAAITALRAGAASPYVDPRLKDVPVNFLSNVDTTGGNSGSPTLNARGELVGLLFDGTYDTVASDYFHDRERTRSIHCDSRYLLWVLTAVERADELLRELTVTP
jgi:hypothetical protein